MPKLQGVISVTGFPKHIGLIVDLAFFEVEGPDALPPYDGNPPANSITDCEKIFEEEVDPLKVSDDSAIDIPFAIERPSGFYYVQPRLILFQSVNQRIFAQVEQFFFKKRPVCLDVDRQELVTFPITWPPTPPDKLPSYGTIKPQSKRSWFQFWRRKRSS